MLDKKITTPINKNNANEIVLHFLENIGVNEPARSNLASQIKSLIETTLSQGRLDNLGVGQVGDAASLAAMTLNDRQKFLDCHYSKRSRWESVRSIEPTMDDMLKWVEKEFPDRRELGLVLSDLKHLDFVAYQKVLNWSRRTQNGKPFKMPPEFGFPRKKEVNDALIAAGAIPTGTEIFKSLREGDPSASAKLRLCVMAKNRKRRAQVKYPC